MHFFARHGVMPQEAQVGQDYEVNLTIHISDACAIGAKLDDNLQGTENYAEVYKVVREQMLLHSDLLEHLGHRICKSILDIFPMVYRADLSITKLAPPIEGFDGRGVSVWQSLQRTLVVLDFDGTLADTSKGIVETMTAVFNHFGYPVPSTDAICHTIGLPLRDSIALLANIGGNALDEAVNLYHEYFEEIGTRYIQLFPGVKSTLETLHRMGCTLAIATSRGHVSVTSLCSNLGILPYLSSVLACEDVKQAKPHPEAVLKLMKEFGIPAERTWVVGDTTYDIGMGSQAAASTIGVTYGNHSRTDLEGASATCVVDSFEEVLPLVMPTVCP